jgi:hypothetical protein
LQDALLVSVYRAAEAMAKAANWSPVSEQARVSTKPAPLLLPEA